MAIDEIIYYSTNHPPIRHTNFEIHSACENHEHPVLKGQNVTSLVNQDNQK
jgi:hypothetical protein